MRIETCSIDGCSSVRKTRGMCTRHYNRWHRYGDPYHGDEAVACTCGAHFKKRNGLGKYCSVYCRTKEGERVRRLKYATDESYRKRGRSLSRLSYKKNREGRLARQKESHQRRFASEPEYVDRKRKISREHARKRRADPIEAQKMRERTKLYQLKQRAIMVAVKELGLINIGDLK